MIVRVLQSAWGRLFRVVIGFLLVIYAAYLPLGLSVIALLAGTTIGVMGIAGACLLAPMFGLPFVSAEARESHV